MQEIKIFENADFGTIRTAEINGKPYFMANDIAKALGYSKPNNAISAHCRAALKYSTPISGKMQEVNFIPEGDVYRLIVRSKLPQAEKFESWVFDEVLPSIRQTGRYGNFDVNNVICEIVKQVISEAIKQIIPIITETKESYTPKEIRKIKADDIYRVNGERLRQPTKMETFPSEIVECVNIMLDDMEERDALNFKYIERFCGKNGYSISSASVKTYYIKRKRKQEIRR